MIFVLGGESTARAKAAIGGQAEVSFILLSVTID